MSEHSHINFNDTAQSLLIEGVKCCHAGQFSLAVEYFIQTSVLLPRSSSPLSNRAYALKRLQRYDEALNDLRSALSLNPLDPELHWNYALLLLIIGYFAEYEWRWQWAGLPTKLRNLGLPLWKPESDANEIVLVQAEQGFGDTIENRGLTIYTIGSLSLFA